MISTVSFHPFISHFPTALFVAGLLLLFLANKKKDVKLKSAGAFNLSLGLLAAVVACFSGMVSVFPPTFDSRLDLPYSQSSLDLAHNLYTN